MTKQHTISLRRAGCIYTASFCHFSHGKPETAAEKLFKITESG